MYCFLVKNVIEITHMNELLLHPLLRWYATSGSGGLGNGNQVLLGNVCQYSDMKFLKFQDRG